MKRSVPRLGAAVLWCVMAAPAALHADHEVGAWLSPADDNWPLIPIHMVLTPDGRVLSYGTDGTGVQTGFFIYDVWDPSAGLEGGHLTLENFTQTDLFCSAQVVLPQSGSVVLSGGDNWTGNATTNQGNPNSNLFNPADNSLNRSSDMNRPRWYASATVLQTGEVYIQGGTGGHDRPEVRGLDGTYRLLDQVDTSTLSNFYPRNFVVPDGRLIGFDAAGSLYYLNVNSDWSLVRAGNLGGPLGATTSSAMFVPGRIIVIGGNSRIATLIDTRTGQPIVTGTQPLSTQRQWVSATLLADGRVLATGGSGVDNELTDVNNSAEIWDPATGQWTVGPSGSRARLYHSTAMLLPDASVLVAGGGAPGPLVNRHAEIYYPSYLYDESGEFASRPTVTQAPDAVDAGQRFAIEVDAADVERITLLKTGAVTHSANMDQRFVEPAFSVADGTTYVQLPANPAETPPGYYMLFAFDAAGVPSTAHILRINIPTVPIGLVDYTPVIGRLGAANFQVECNADEAAVGIYGHSAGIYVNRIGVQCVRVDQAGRWIDDPVDRGAAGTPTGDTFVRTCPRDWAIAGFRGRSGDFVDQIDIECRTLTASGTVTGNGEFMGPVGGTGGTGQGPFACNTGNPVYKLIGQSGGWLDAFGMHCRAVQLTNVGGNSPPLLTNPGNQTHRVGDPISLQLQASDADEDSLSFDATGLPAGLAIDGSTGLISGAPTITGTSNVVASVSDGTEQVSVAFTWTVSSAQPLVLDPMPKQAPVLAGTQLSYTATAHNGHNVRYKWFFDDGSETNWSASPAVTHTFASPGFYWVTVTAQDDAGVPQSQTFAQLAHLPLSAQRPANSSGMAIANGRLWIVNPDGDSVSAFSTADHAKLAQITVGGSPRSLAVAPDGRIWVSNRRSANISIINPTTMKVTNTVGMPAGSRPHGLVFAPNGSAAYIALESSGLVRKLNPANGATLATVAVGATPRHLAIDAASTRLLVSRFVTPPLPGESTEIVATAGGGGEVLVLDPITLATLKTIVLRHSDDADSESTGGGLPNYLGAAAISPDGTAAWVPSKKDNVRRGTLRSGLNLNFQNTVRAISSRIDLGTESETFGQRLDHDNASVASAAVFERYGVFLFVALETSREIAVVNAHEASEYFRIPVGKAPQWVEVSPSGERLYVGNFMDRSVGVYDLRPLIEEGQWQAPLLAKLSTVASESLSPTILTGKQLFYDAFDPRLAQDRYLSCASCHNDGGGDGRVWDLSGFGEGLRNTISLNGRAGGHGLKHWSGNFDEIQDFESQIRDLARGAGLMDDVLYTAGTRSHPLGDTKAGLSTDLDALAAYVASLSSYARSPHRNSNGTLTTAGVAGKAVFDRLSCAQCHAGPEFTISEGNNRVNIGTIRQPTSGKRLGAALDGIDIPTLREVWATEPYLHDGSAATLEAAVRAHAGVSISNGDLSKLTAYLRQIDSLEPGPQVLAPNAPPVLQDPGAQSAKVGSVVSLQLNGSDPNGDTLTYQATSLPGGLSINSSTGLISGKPKKAGSWNSTVTVNDGKGASATVAIHWTITK